MDVEAYESPILVDMLVKSYPVTISVKFATETLGELYTGRNNKRIVLSSEEVEKFSFDDIDNGVFNERDQDTNMQVRAQLRFLVSLKGDLEDKEKNAQLLEFILQDSDIKPNEQGVIEVFLKPTSGDWHSIEQGKMGKPMFVCAKTKDGKEKKIGVWKKHDPMAYDMFKMCRMEHFCPEYIPFDGGVYQKYMGEFAERNGESYTKGHKEINDKEIESALKGFTGEFERTNEDIYWFTELAFLFGIQDTHCENVLVVDAGKSNEKKVVIIDNECFYNPRIMFAANNMPGEVYSLLPDMQTFVKEGAVHFRRNFQQIHQGMTDEFYQRMASADKRIVPIGTENWFFNRDFWFRRQANELVADVAFWLITNGVCKTVSENTLVQIKELWERSLRLDYKPHLTFANGKVKMDEEEIADSVLDKDWRVVKAIMEKRFETMAQGILPSPRDYADIMRQQLEGGMTVVQMLDFMKKMLNSILDKPVCCKYHSTRLCRYLDPIIDGLGKTADNMRLPIKAAVRESNEILSLLSSMDINAMNISDELKRRIYNMKLSTRELSEVLLPFSKIKIRKRNIMDKINFAMEMFKYSAEPWFCAAHGMTDFQLIIAQYIEGKNREMHLQTKPSVLRKLPDLHERSKATVNSNKELQTKGIEI